MNESDLINLLVKLFAKYKINYLLTGGFAVSYWGRPRATHDIDFLIEIYPDDLPRLMNVFTTLDKDFIIDRDQISQAIKTQSQFNIIYLP